MFNKVKNDIKEQTESIFKMIVKKLLSAYDVISRRAVAVMHRGQYN